jgi:hypothetical protein
MSGHTEGIQNEFVRESGTFCVKRCSCKVISDYDFIMLIIPPLHDTHMTLQLFA